MRPLLEKTQQVEELHGPPQSFASPVPTAEMYRHRAEEAKRFAKQSRDVWEKEILLRVATQWQLLEAHKEAKESRIPSAPDPVRLA